MPALRNKGARGPLKKLFLRSDKDDIILDLMAYYKQKADGIPAGENGEKVSLASISRKYNISTATLQGYEEHVVSLMKQVTEASAVVGVTPLDYITKVQRYYRRVEMLADRAAKSGDADTEIVVLERLYPLALSKLEGLLPRSSTGDLMLSGGKSSVDDKALPQGGIQVNVLTALAQGGKDRPKPIELQRADD